MFQSQGIAIDVAIDVAIRQLKITHILNVTKAGAKSLQNHWLLKEGDQTG